MIGQPIPVEAITNGGPEAARPVRRPAAHPPALLAPAGARPGVPCPPRRCRRSPTWPCRLVFCLQPAHPARACAHPAARAGTPAPGQPQPPTAAAPPGTPASRPHRRRPIPAGISRAHRLRKELRQSTNQNLLLAVQYMAGRCDQKTSWPATTTRTLPLGPVRRTGNEVYLLDKPIISGDQEIENASSLG